MQSKKELSSDGECCFCRTLISINNLWYELSDPATYELTKQSIRLEKPIPAQGYCYNCHQKIINARIL